MSKLKIKESSKTNENFNVLNLVVHCFLFNFWKKKDLVVYVFGFFTQFGLYSIHLTKSRK